MISVGQTIGNYMLTAKLGEGGMGVVYLAEHPVIGRRVAMKAIHPELSRNPEVVSRFMTEAKSVNQIGNEHIVDIHDFGTTSDGEFYFIMEFLQGEALSDCLKSNAPLDTSRALAIAAQVADALASSHEHGIIHRDLKPENIFLITKGHVHDFVKVLDFGLAKLTQGDDKVSHKTRTGSVMGTPYYMAPEQCEGKAAIDHRADIYSLGVILFEMVTGKVPFGGEGYGEIIVKHMTAAVPWPRAINPLLPASVEAVILRALAKSREARFQTMGEFGAALADPEAYATSVVGLATQGTSLAMPTVSEAGAIPDDRANTISGQVVFGGSDPNLGERPVPLPSTFRHATGELLDDDIPPARPKRPRTGFFIFGAAVVGVALAAFLFTQNGSSRIDGASAEKSATTAVPPAPKRVRLGFKSEPPGAEVLRKDTSEKLGITPLTIELSASDAPIDFLFKKDSFQEKTESFVPSESGQLAVVLTPAPSTPEPARPRAEAASEAKPAKVASPVRRKPTPSRKSTGHAMDEDGVLAPSF
jgi:eukaryotic-like serine/threonine-protein kinase